MANETLITKGNLVATTFMLRKEYLVSFEIKPTSFVSSEYRSVIHLTTGSDSEIYGRRTPAVFFNEGKLHICSAVKGQIDYNFNTSPLELGTWSLVKISQQFVDGKYFYVIDLNYTNVLKIENTDAREFSNVKVYVSSPWFKPQPGFVRNILITNGNPENFLMDKETPLLKGLLIKTIKKLSMEYSVYFEIKPSFVQDRWNNVIKLITEDNMNYNIGYNNPAVWFNFKEGNILYICSTIDAMYDHCVRTNDYQSGKWYSIKISQKCFEGKYNFSIDVNNNSYLIHDENTNANELPNVKVYASGPLYDAQPGLVKNFRIYNRNKAFWSEWSDWTHCNDFHGFINRTRKCNFSKAEYWCCGNNIEVKECIESFIMENETSLSKGNLIGTITLLHKEYTVSFEVKPTAFLNEWTNVIHFTIGEHNTHYGDRNPSVFFCPNDKGKIQICSAICGTTNYFYTVPLELGTWSLLRISQQFVDGKYIYSIDLNCTNVFQVNNTDAREFSNVKVYVSNPWSEPQPGFFKNLRITNGNLASWTQWSNWSSCNTSYKFTNRSRDCVHLNPSDWCCGNNTEVKECLEWTSCNDSYGLMNKTRECNASIDLEWCSNKNSEDMECFETFKMENVTLLQKGTLVATIERLNKEYSVSFDVLPTAFKSSYTSVIHFTTGYSNLNYGDRNPAVYFYKNNTGQVLICSALNRTISSCKNTTSLEPDKWYSIKISQKFLERKYIYSIDLNCKNIFETVNTDARDFLNVKVYISDPWHEAQPGFIRNLKIANGNPVIYENNCSCCNVSYYSQPITIIRMCSIFTSKNNSCSQNKTLKESFSMEKETPLSKGYLVAVLKSFNKNYTLSFEIKPKKVLDGLSSVIQLTAGEDMIINEYQTPAAWFYSKKGVFKICFALGPYTDHCTTTNFFPLNYWTSIKILQQCFQGKYMYSIQINGTNIINKENTDPKEFLNVKVFISDPWYSVQPAVMRNLNITTGNPASWTQWSNWLSCNASHKFTNRSRECNSSNPGDWCCGSNTELKECIEKWTTWSECSVTCGYGNRIRLLLQETNAVVKQEDCNLINCPVDGMWGQWNNTECSSTCGYGIQLFNRSCNNPLYNGQYCLGVSNYTEVCNGIICPVNGDFSMWSLWSLCSQPCKGGIKSRFRSCTNPIPMFGGQSCNGRFEEFDNCSLKDCKTVNLNLHVKLYDEVYSNTYSLSSSYGLSLEIKIQDAIERLYSSYNIYPSFNVVIHSTKESP